MNDEVPANTAFLEQAAPDTGDDEAGTVQAHEGFMAGGDVLTAYPAADFLAEGFEVLRITVTEVPPNPINVKVELGESGSRRRELSHSCMGGLPRREF